MLWLPEAIRDAHPEVINPWTTTRNPKGVLHTTEGAGWPDYSGWTINPHATVMPSAGKGVTVRQHIPFSSGSFALENHAGGVQTNRAFAFQFELIGTSEKGGPGYYWPGADDAVLADLYRKVIKPLSDAVGIPRRAATFKAYPASYGTNNGVRLSGTEWTNFSGWLGHQHVPENVHGDPGAFPWARMLAAADAPPVTATNPPFPLPEGWYFGPEDGPKESVSGYHGHGDDLKTWQSQMSSRGWQIDVDGLYGPNTMKIAAQFQKEKGLTVDGRVGKLTWDAAWTARVT